MVKKLLWQDCDEGKVSIYQWQNAEKIQLTISMAREETNNRLEKATTREKNHNSGYVK